MKKKKLLLATGLVVTSAFVLGACNNETVEEKVDKNVDEIKNENKVKEDTKPVLNEKGEKVDEELTEPVKIFKSDEQAEDLIEEEVTIILNEESPPETRDIELINHLVHLSNPMQGEVKLETLIIEDKVLKLNFGESITKVQGSAGGLMFMNSITETIFANFDKDVIESVMFVYGEDGTDFLDHVTVNEVIKRK